MADDVPKTANAPTPEMIAAAADVLEHIGGMGRWVAESLAEQAITAALGASERALPSPIAALDMRGLIPCGEAGCCAIRCRFS